MTWLTIFILLSLLAHAIVFMVILLLSRVIPAPKLDQPPPPSPEVTLSLQPAPVASPPPKKIFMPTPEQPNAPHRETQVESDHDTQLASHSKADRAPDTIMPDVTSEQKHPDQLTNSPNSPTNQKTQATPTPPSPDQDQPKPPQPTPTPPNPAPPQPVKTQPPEPKPSPPSPPQVTQNKVDPDTGLPVLPPINAPTLAPQTTRPKTVAAPKILPSVAADLEGRAGMSGEPTAAAMATELGKYKAEVYRRVGSRWYDKVDKQLQILPVGMVKIQYTIYSDGTVQTKLLEGGNLQLLYAVSQNSITESAPFPPFTDAMIKEVGDSYTDYFTFSVYTP